MKRKIIGLLISAVVLFFVYSFFSCGTDYFLHLNLACPASWFVKSPPASLDNQIKAVEPGTYVVYSVIETLKSAADSEPIETFSELYSYRLEDKKNNKLFSSGNLLSFHEYGTKVLVTDMFSSSSVQTLVDMSGDKTLIDGFSYPIFSENGRTKVLVDAKNLDANDMSCTKDILEIKISGEDGIDSIDKTFVWKDYGLNQLCPENYFISNNGKYFYVIGDLMGAGSVDTLMKYSVNEDKMTKIEVGKNSWLGSWQLDADNGWFVGVTLGYNLEPTEIVRINLFSSEITTLTEPNSYNIYQVFLSTDGNFWSPVFSDGIEGVSSCVRVLPVGEKMVNDDSQCLLGGKVIDWRDNLLVVNRDGELVLYDLITKKTVVLDKDIAKSWDPNYQSAEYVGTIKID